MSSIAELTEGDRAFDPQAIEAMSIALEDVCKALGINGNASARDVIAIRIIELARRGERSATKLCDLLLAEANSGSGC
jgi:hypothetical protein